MADQSRGGEDRRPSITIVLVDDEPMIRAGLAQTLSGDGLEVIGEAGNGDDALGLVLDLRPDVVLIDIKLPGISGVEAIGRLGLLAPASKVLVLTRTEQNRVVEAIIAGASGYILKTAPPKAITSAVRATAAGECVLSPQIAGKLLQHIREREIPITATNELAADAVRAALTTRELEIFALLASGETNQQIADKLSLSTHTIRNHVKNILAKLQLDNRIQAAAHAVRTGIS
jgi:two-component system, NarL family, response regulator LiaR